MREPLRREDFVEVEVEENFGPVEVWMADVGKRDGGEAVRLEIRLWEGRLREPWDCACGGRVAVARVEWWSGTWVSYSCQECETMTERCWAGGVVEYEARVPRETWNERQEEARAAGLDTGTSGWNLCFGPLVLANPRAKMQCPNCGPVEGWSAAVLEMNIHIFTKCPHCGHLSEQLLEPPPSGGCHCSP